LLAAVGVAVVFTPEFIKALESRKKVRWFLAFALLALGIAGLLSSHLQRRSSERAEASLNAMMAKTNNGVQELAEYTKRTPVFNVPVLQPRPIVPKIAKLQFTFWPTAAPHFEPVTEITALIVNGVITVDFSAKGVGNLQADNGKVWMIQICDGCRYAEEPDGATAPDNDLIVRQKRFDSLAPGVAFIKTTLKLIPPPGVDSFTIAFKYSCERCPPVDNEHPQKLRVRIAQS